MTLTTQVSYRAPLPCDPVASTEGSGHGHRVQALTLEFEQDGYSRGKVLRKSEHVVHSCRACGRVVSGLFLVAAVWLEVSGMDGDWVSAVTGTVTLVEAGPIRSGFWIFAKTRRRAAAALRFIT